MFKFSSLYSIGVSKKLKFSTFEVVDNHNKILPVYSLDKFRHTPKKGQQFHVEVFDANRHFEVSYPHRHDFYEVLFLTHGSGVHIIDDNNYEINPPCVFFMSPGQAHKLELSQDIKGYIFLFTDEFYILNQKNKNRLLEFPFFFSTDKTNPPLALSENEDVTFLETLFQRVCNEISSQVRIQELIRSVLDLILLTCDKLYPESLRTVHFGKGHLMVKNFLQLIEENYHHNLRVNHYAELLSVTPNHLTQTVREITGKTSLALIQEKSIVEIKRLLVHTNMNVTEIADAMNFQDQSYFTKYFKKVTGITPLQFRRESMKNT